MSMTEFAEQRDVGIRAVIHPAAEGGYWATVPAFPGCVTEGDTLEEVEANVREAAEVWLCTKLRACLQIRRPRRTRERTLA